MYLAKLVSELDAVLSHMEVKANGVNGDNRATGEVLQGAGEEGLREEEAADPKDGRDAI